MRSYTLTLWKLDANLTTRSLKMLMCVYAYVNIHGVVVRVWAFQGEERATLVRVVRCKEDSDKGE